MPRAAPDDGDTWVGVKDPKKRKQIQDRLAQRARRRRLAEQKKTGSSATGTVAALPSSTDAARAASRPSSALSSAADPSRSRVAISLLSTPLDVYSALWNNGALLGLTCSSTTPTLSKDLGPSTPQTLRPSPIQLMTLHPPWIDRFPFPTMRDNFITLLGIVDPEDFLCDIFNIPSFTVEPQGPSWDPGNWKIETEFGKKWGFLFNPNLLDFPHKSAASPL